MGAEVRVLRPPGCHGLPELRAAGTLWVSLPALFLGTERLRQKEVAQLMENPLSLSILRSKNTRGLSSAWGSARLSLDAFRKLGPSSWRPLDSLPLSSSSWEDCNTKKPTGQGFRGLKVRAR